MRIFTSVCAHKDYRIGNGDATSTFSWLYPPIKPTYVRVNRQFQKWCLEQHGINGELNVILPVQQALQGYPKSGRVW